MLPLVASLVLFHAFSISYCKYSSILPRVDSGCPLNGPKPSSTKVIVVPFSSSHLYSFNRCLPVLDYKTNLIAAIWILAAYLNPEVSRADYIRIIVVYIPHLMPAAVRTLPAVMPADSFLVPAPDSIRLFLPPDILDAEREQRQQLNPSLAEYHLPSP